MIAAIGDIVKSGLSDMESAVAFPGRTLPCSLVEQPLSVCTSVSEGCLLCGVLNVYMLKME